MELQTLSVKTRAEQGKGPAGRSRMAGEIPGVLYGEGKETVSLLLNVREFDNILHGKLGEHAVLDLAIADNPDLGGPAIIKDVQHHPVRGHVMHADIMRINLDKKIRTLVPIKLEGRSASIIEGGVLDNQLREIEIECLPTDIPDFIISDITDLEIGQSIHVEDLVFDDNVTVLTDPSRTVAAVHAPRVVEEVEVEVEGEEGVEGEGEGSTEEGGEETSAESSDEG